MLTKSNSIGYAILSLIINQLSDEEVREINVEPYLNGRESGFAIMFHCGFRHANNLHDRKFVFSNSRRSDGISVYESTSWGFSMQGNCLTDEIYRNSISFIEGAVVAARDHILTRMLEHREIGVES